MISSERASFIAHRWIEAWNNRDIDMILQNYSSRIRYTTPMAIFYTKNEDYTIVGKRRLKEYFSQGMRFLPKAHFKIQDITIGVDSISIIYRISQQKIAVEVMFINEKGKVYKSYAYKS